MNIMFEEQMTIEEITSLDWYLYCFHKLNKQYNELTDSDIIKVICGHDGYYVPHHDTCNFAVRQTHFGSYHISNGLTYPVIQICLVKPRKEHEHTI